MLLSRIAKQKNTGTDIEMDIAYVNSTIRDERYERPIAIRSCILADSRTEMVIDQYLLAPEDDEVQYVLDMVINYILNIGKPRRIFVRDEYLLYLLTDLCERGKIDLQVKERLKAIDRFVESFSEFQF
ncbi:hypothetical protein V7D15_08870 [Thermoanaerobacter thermohydrosulfuricus]|uniref:DUF6930 domain-containing protein n=1 Tax=Thermoanaerobacter sp. RKWS2 TaxID=2983842 RepID=UPI0012FD1C31|nr:hypothetical protein [Thermoanaerobacter sp. RKWS2]UZQ82201.1 hypothetical protein OEI98_002017 [Thermoanaerobacter sp. RKWS2]